MTQDKEVGESERDESAEEEPEAEEKVVESSTISKGKWKAAPARAKVYTEVEGPVRGHPSVSLLPLSSPTLHLFICNPPPHLCTISKNYT
jgi:hypothetical protein